MYKMFLQNKKINDCSKLVTDNLNYLVETLFIFKICVNKKNPYNYDKL